MDLNKDSKLALIINLIVATIRERRILKTKPVAEFFAKISLEEIDEVLTLLRNKLDGFEIRLGQILREIIHSSEFNDLQVVGINCRDKEVKKRRGIAKKINTLTSLLFSVNPKKEASIVTA